MSKLLVVAVHPDDETLGAGGTLLRHAQAGGEIYWLILTGMKEEYGWDQGRIRERAAEIDRVKESYGFTDVCQLELKPAGLDEYPLGEIVSGVAGFVERIQPDEVILPNRSDAHTDHRVGFDACFALTKSFRYPSIRRVCSMETVSETEFGYEQDFRPSLFVDISTTFQQKLEIMNLYESELQEHPFPRSKRALEALAVARGSQAGCEYAEAFRIHKQVE